MLHTAPGASSQGDNPWKPENRPSLLIIEFDGKGRNETAGDELSLMDLGFSQLSISKNITNGFCTCLCIHPTRRLFEIDNLLSYYRCCKCASDSNIS